MGPSSNINNIWGHSKNELLRFLLAYQQAIDTNICHSITDINGTIVYVNNKFCELSKYSQEEVIGQNHRILKSGEHTNEFYQNLWDTIKQGKKWKGEVKNKAKDNTYYWTDTVILPVADGNKNILQYLALRYPITDKKQLEQEKNEYIKSLEEMIFMTSHEVRQPVANLLGLVNIIDNFSRTKKDFMKIAEYIKESAKRLDTFTKKLTTYMHDLKLKNKKWEN